DRVRVLDVKRRLLRPANHHRSLGGVERRNRAFRLQDREVGRSGEVEASVERRQLLADALEAVRVDDDDRLALAGEALLVERTQVVCLLSWNCWGE
ncbi:MAG: hypothetical protein ABSC35_13475, partial [Candidatus Dormibacteria bacterium]